MAISPQVATYYCRHCESTEDECQKQLKENKRKIRTKAKYEKLVEKATRSNTIDLKETRGIKRSCEFNNLKFYHVIDNLCVDLMHDFNEGVISSCIKDFFELMISKGILSLADIQRRVRDFNYSQVNKYNTPSMINVNKHNLNQSASQIYILMLHMPFIVYDIKDKIQEFWTPVKTLLECMQIIFSKVITESDIEILERNISKYLKSTIDIFERKLTPKHHFLVHYPESIRKMGPPIHCWTMRLEAKHKVFTEIARYKKNFINICKTMADCHQERCSKNPTVDAHIIISAIYGRFDKTLELDKFREIITECIGSERIPYLPI